MQFDSKLDDEITSEEARAIVDQARAEVLHALQKIDDETSAWIKNAEDTGVKRGFEQAEQLRAKLAKLQDLMRSEVENEVVRSAFDVAESMLKAELKVSPEAMIHVIQTALKSVPEVSQVSLRVNPADADIVRQNKQKVVDVLERAKDVDVKEDKQVERGGVLIQTEAGVVDAQLKTQLEEIARVLGV